MRKRLNHGQRGSTMIEFVLVSSMFLVPLLLGIFTYGFAVLRQVQVVQFTRDGGHMYSRGVDFAVQANQNLLTTQLGQGLNIVSNSGNVTGGTTGYGVVVFSTFTKIGAATCACTNAGHIVVMNRIVVGNKTKFTTHYGAPNAGSITSTGDITNYANDISARADNFNNLLTMNNSDIAYLSESF
ncbi:MAG TPA: TadE family protein, partial [Bryobacteraceae bacterium]|nr:TadE family protein [Bryobacteraceae bacterium]